MTINGKIIEKEKEYLFFKNGKAKKQYCKCLSVEQRRMFRKLYGREIIQCAGNGCPYYSTPICGRYNIENYNNME